MKTRNLTTGNIQKQILFLAIPAILSGILGVAYGLIDMFFLGRYGGSNVLAGVGSATLYIGFSSSVIALASTGLGIKSSQTFGKNDMDSYYKYLKAGYFIVGVIIIFFFILYTLLTDTLLSGLDTESQVVYDNAKSYLKIFGFTFIFSALNVVYTRIVSAFGRTDITLNANFIGVVVNICLDPILIFYFNLGVVGAALATLIGTATTTFIFLYTSKQILAFKKNDELDKDCAKEIVRLGYPYTVQRLLFTYIGLLTGQALISFGDEVIAAQRLGFQIEAFTLTIIGGLYSATSSFVGQNFGAGNYDRVKKGVNVSLIYGSMVAIFTSIVFLLFSEQIAGIFISEPTAIYYTSMYLKFIALGQIFGMAEMIMNATYTGLGLTKIPTLISITITPLRLVFALYLSKFYGVEIIFFGILFTTVLKGGVAYGYYVLKIKRQIGTRITS